VEENSMTIGTKSVLYGAHCFFLHPWFVAAAWWKLYGFPWDPRLWVAFFVHDLGYIGKPNMDGPEGESHPWFGAKVLSWLFDDTENLVFPSLCGRTIGRICTRIWGRVPGGSGNWFSFSLYHSRYLSKRYGARVSQLCFADKLSFALTPRWLYLPAVNATGEINEYLKNAQKADSGHWKPTGFDQRKWHAQLCDYMTRWVEEHKSGADDTWTDANRHAITDGGVWK
jgi:hypothetical protein